MYISTCIEVLQKAYEILSLSVPLGALHTATDFLGVWEEAYYYLSPARCDLQNRRLITTVTSGRRQHQLPTVPQAVGNDTMPPVSSVRNLGILADLSMRTRVLKTTSGCFAVLRRIKTIRRSVYDSRLLQSLMVALVL